MTLPTSILSVLVGAPKPQSIVCWHAGFAVGSELTCRFMDFYEPVRGQRQYGKMRTGKVLVVDEQGGCIAEPQPGAWD